MNRYRARLWAHCRQRTGLPGERDYGRAEWDTADASRAGRGELSEIGGNDRGDWEVIGAFPLV
jgi:hypothetical protein